MLFQKKEFPELALLRNEVAQLRADNALLTALSDFSQEEMIVVVDASKRIVMQNALAKAMIKSPEQLTSLLTPQSKTVTMEGCTGTVTSKSLNDSLTAYSIIKVDVRNSKDSHILTMHQLLIVVHSLRDHENRCSIQVRYIVRLIYHVL